MSETTPSPAGLTGTPSASSRSPRSDPAHAPEVPATQPSGAQAASRYKVGIGDQSVSVFGDPLFQALKLKRIRYIVPWNWNADATQEAEVRGYLSAARAARFEPFVTFTAARGCWTGAVYRRTKACRAPSASAYTKRFKAFRRAFPTVKVFSAWNEANHKSQPVYKSPRKAAQYYNAMRKACRSCTIVALNLAHAVLSPGGSLPVRVAAVARGTRDYVTGRFGPG